MTQNAMLNSGRKAIAVAFWIGLASVGFAQGPELDSVFPRGAARGSEVTISFRGERLDRVTGILFDGQGLKLQAIRSVAPESVEAVVAVDPACRLGEHAFWLMGPHGVSEVATLRVGRFAVSEEAEPNDEAASATTRPLETTLVGTIEEADIDCFGFRLNRGERLSAEVEAMRRGGSFFDPLLEVIGPSGQVVARCDDTALTMQDPILSMIADEEGVHVVRLREAAFGGGPDARYRLHVGRSHQPLVAYPAGGRPGDKLSAQLIGDAGGPYEETVEIPADAIALHEHRPTGDCLTPLRVRVADLDNALEREPNNEPQQANDAGAVPIALNGILQAPGDADWFTFNAEVGVALEVQVWGARIGSPIDSVVEVVGPDDAVVVRNDDGAVHDSEFRFTPTIRGLHKLRVTDHLQRGGEGFVYRVEIDRPRPGLELTLPIIDEIYPQRGQAITVPRGGRSAALVAVGRRGFSGNVRVEVQGSPEGVTLETQEAGPREHLIPMLFEAANDAPLGARLVCLVGYGESSQGTVVGELHRSVGLTFGQPRRTAYHAIDLNTTPLVVTAEAPFDLRVAVPMASLPQDGLLELAVTVERRKSFAGTIELDALLLPRRIERSEDPVRLVATNSKATFPLIAGDGATPGEYEVILLGKARYDGGTIRVATPPIPIRVVEPYAAVAIEAASTAQGVGAVVACRLDWDRTPEGPGTATLRGLPSHASAADVKIKPGQKRFEFPVEVGAETPASLHNTLFVELSVPESGEPVRQYLGRGGVLEVFPEGGVARDPLSRLEQLRREAGLRVTERGAPR